MLARLIFSGSIVVAALAIPAHAQDANYANRLAYKYAIRCFVTAGIARNMPSENPGSRRTSQLTAMSEGAYNSAFQMGERLGYPEREISADLDRAQDAEARALLQNPAYFAETKAACIKLGFMQA